MQDYRFLAIKPGGHTMNRSIPDGAVFPNDFSSERRMADQSPLPGPSFITPSRKWPLILTYLAGFVGCMMIGFHPTILSGLDRMQTDAGDTVLNHYFLEHSWRWLSDPSYHASFWSPRFFHPTPYALTYSENMVGVAPIYWGLRLGLSEQMAWQGWILLMTAMNYCAMVVVLRWFGVNPILAILGGIFFAVSLPRQDQFSHQQLQPHLFAPFVVWYFWKFTRQPARREWFMILLLTAWQLLASIHLGWFLLFALGIWMVVLPIIDRRLFARVLAYLKANPLCSMATLSLWCGGLFLFFRNYYLGNESFRRSYYECLWYMPRWSAWFACPEHSLWGVYLVPGDDSLYAERHLCAGAGFYILLFFGLVGARHWRNDPEKRHLYLLACSGIVCCLLMVLLTMYYGWNLSPWSIFYYAVPGANSIRVIGRISLTVILLGSIVGLVAFQHLIEEKVRSRLKRTLIYCLLLFLCVGEQVRFQMDSFRRDDFYPRAIGLAEQLHGADVAYIHQNPDVIRYKYEHQITCMWAGLEANMPVVNGFSGRVPTGYFNDDDDVSLADIVRFLGKDWKGRLLVVRWGTPMQKRYYDIEPGSQPAERIKSVETVDD